MKLDASNGGVLRTGIQPASAVGEMDGSALELPYLIYSLSEVLLFSDLAGAIPPISEGNATVSNISIGRSGQNLVATRP